MTNDWGASVSSGLVAVAAAGTGTSYIINNVGSYMYIGCQGKENGDYGTYVACPGGSVLSVPMSVDNAAAACACDNGNTCTVGWMYY